MRIVILLALSLAASNAFSQVVSPRQGSEQSSAQAGTTPLEAPQPPTLLPAQVERNEERSAGEDTAPARRIRFGFGLIYSANQAATFNSGDVSVTTTTTQTVKVTAESEHESALGLAVEGRFFNPLSRAGIQVQAEHIPPHKVTKFSFASSGGTSNVSSQTLRYSQTVLSGNLLFGREDIYGLAGLNISVPRLTGEDGINVYGGIGGQAGLGGVLQEHVVFEGSIQVTSLALIGSERAGSTLTTIDLKEGFVRALRISVKYLF